MEICLSHMVILGAVALSPMKSDAASVRVGRCEKLFQSIDQAMVTGVRSSFGKEFKLPGVDPMYASLSQVTYVGRYDGKHAAIDYDGRPVFVSEETAAQFKLVPGRNEFPRMEKQSDPFACFARAVSYVFQLRPPPGRVPSNYELNAQLNGLLWAQVSKTNFFFQYGVMGQWLLDPTGSRAQKVLESTEKASVESQIAKAEDLIARTGASFRRGESPQELIDAVRQGKVILFGARTMGGYVTAFDEKMNELERAPHGTPMRRGDSAHTYVGLGVVSLGFYEYLVYAESMSGLIQAVRLHDADRLGIIVGWVFD